MAQQSAKADKTARAEASLAGLCDTMDDVAAYHVTTNDYMRVFIMSEIISFLQLHNNLFLEIKQVSCYEVSRLSR